MEISKEEIGKVIKFTKKPVEIEAIQWTGKNINDVLNFMGWRNAEHDTRTGLGIFTLEGRMQANEGDWIIKGIQGEFYPCKPDIFEKTYQVSSTTPQSVEMSLEECKDEYARHLNFEDWEHYSDVHRPTSDTVEWIAELYASQFKPYKIKAEQLQAELEKVKAILKDIIPMAEDGYKRAVSNGAHQEFLSEDRELLAKANKAIQSTETKVDDKS